MLSPSAVCLVMLYPLGVACMGHESGSLDTTTVNTAVTTLDYTRLQQHYSVQCPHNTSNAGTRTYCSSTPTCSSSAFIHKLFAIPKLWDITELSPLSSAICIQCTSRLELRMKKYLVSI